MRLEISLISKYRNELMGLAAIGIILCHAGPRGVELGGVMKNLFSLGQVGNALFFLLSGFGLFYSLSKISNSLSSYILWYKKRLLRIFVPYLIWVIPFFIYQIIKFPDTDWFEWIYCFSLLSYWDGSGGVAWFLSVLILFYLLSPLVFKVLMCENRTLRNYIVLSISLSITFFLSPDNVTLRLLCRNAPNLICFISGMLLGYFSKMDKNVNIIWFWGLSALCYVLHFLNINRTGSDMFHFGSCLLFLPVFLTIFSKSKRSLKLLNGVGKISLESYLTNGALPRVVALIPWTGVASNWNTGNYLGYGIVIVGGLFSAWVLHRFSTFIINKLDTSI